MKNYITKTLMLLAVVLLAACSSDNDITDEPKQPTTVETTSTPITITARYGDGTSTTRVAYTESGNTISATWEAGDQIYVVYDGQVSTLTLESGVGETTATFSGTINHTNPLTASSVLACYVKDVNNASALTVSGNTLVYSDDAFTAQDGTMAGAAKCNIYSGTTTYGSGENLSCTFGVSTAICKFTPHQIDAADIGQQATLAYESEGNTLARATFTVSDGAVYLAVPAGSYSGIQRVVYNCSANSHSREYDLSYTKGNLVAGQTYSRDLWARLVNIGENQKAYLSPGNLQYQASTATWRFAEHQWDYVGDATNGTVYVGEVKSNNALIASDYTGWIDLFGWGTWGEGKDPWKSVADDANYDQYRWSTDFTGTLANHNDWFTPEKSEWNYLFENNTYGMATVNGVNGVIVLPVNSGLTINTDHNSYSNNEISESVWNSTYGPKGVTFLPAAGYRDLKEANVVINWISEGHYWSKTIYDNGWGYQNLARIMLFKGESGVSLDFGNKYCETGLSVRLVRNAE